jgi:hypothetical protein
MGLINQSKIPGGRDFTVYLKRMDSSKTWSRDQKGLKGVASWIRSNGAANVKKISHKNGRKLNHEEMLEVIGYLSAPN